jgi:hypothetical protein
MKGKIFRGSFLLEIKRIKINSIKGEGNKNNIKLNCLKIYKN